MMTVICPVTQVEVRTIFVLYEDESINQLLKPYLEV